MSRVAPWMRASRLGMIVLAMASGAGAGLGAVAFRWLIFSFTWLATGREQFGQQGRVASTHLPFLGFWFLLLIPVVGGLLYGPLIQRFASEARGHGVPEVMIAVAENGGRIRPQVTVVKALASALCIGTGGSVGREGPIVQIGSALASSLGQFVKMPEARLRIIVACGAAGGIAATFNAPITGVFFGFELILREFSIDALFAIIVSAVTADVISQAFFGSAPFFSAIPHDLSLRSDTDYLLIVLLGVLAGLLGACFKTVLYKIEDFCDVTWGNRPEWARPVVGGLFLGGILLALPEMYGVGYPVMDKVLDGHVVLWLVVLLVIAKMVTASLTIGIGGSGGVFAPSLFTGAMAGVVFGDVARHLFGSGAGSATTYGVVAMGAVFGAAAQAPLTAIASVTEMTGNFGLTLPIMLGVGIAVGVSKRLTYGTIYTTKLLRRGIDIERPRPQTVLQQLQVLDAMQPIAAEGSGLVLSSLDADGSSPDAVFAGDEISAAAPDPQPLYENELLEDALRQLAPYGPEGLPVISEDRSRLVGWITSDDVLRALAASIQAAPAGAGEATGSASRLDGDSRHAAPISTRLDGFEWLEVPVEDFPGLGGATSNGALPSTLSFFPVVVKRGGRASVVNAHTGWLPGDRVVILRRSQATAVDRPADSAGALPEPGPGPAST